MTFRDLVLSYKDRKCKCEFFEGSVVLLFPEPPLRFAEEESFEIVEVGDDFIIIDSLRSNAHTKRYIFPLSYIQIQIVN